MPTLADLRGALLAARRVVLTTHIRPDGDALGSEIALALYLRGQGVEAHVLNAEEEPRTLGWLLDLDGVPKDLVEVYRPGDRVHAERLATADAIVVVDTNAEGRLGDLGKPVREALAKKVLLDHHPDPEGWFDLAVTDTTAAATGELVYDLIAGHDPALVDAPIATALYTAIATDTGSFRYGATTPRTHRIVADILERGQIKPEPIHVAVYDARSPEGLRLLARALDTITLHYGGRLASMYVTQPMLRETGAFFDEIEGLVQYALSLEGVVAAVILLETPSGVKASFRSKGDVPVNEWAARFGGGGHRNASGAYFRDRPLNRVLKEVMNSVPADVRNEPSAPSDAPEASEDDIADLLARFNARS
ncbi:MAG TPA: DHH family phosphoesterase [Rubricoccaceae bacterium]|nr:DHH family phosphoesterase [Rubricoccaceae bacterium]